MSGPVFVDTNVWVYARDSSDRAKHAAARRWLAELWASGAGRTSMQVLNEYYVTIARRLSRPLSADEAWQDVMAMLAWSPRAIDAAVLQQARVVEQRYQFNWWDSLVVAAALLQACTLLLTEDLQDGMVISGLRVLNPFRSGVQEAPPVVRRRSRTSRMAVA